MSFTTRKSEMYIKNIEKEFGEFIPAPFNVTLSDVNQHLLDMFPGLSANICPRANESAERTTSLDFQGFGSRGTSPYNSQESVDESTPSTSVELPTIDIKIQNVQGNYLQHTDDETNTESQSVILDASNAAEATLDEGTGNKGKRNGKRSSTPVSRKPAKKSNVSVISVEDSDEDDSVNGGQRFRAMIIEFRVVSRGMYKCENRLKSLNEQESLIEAKLTDPETTSDENIDRILDELSEVTKQILKYETRLDELKEQKVSNARRDNRNFEFH